MKEKPQTYRKLAGRSSMSVQTAHLGEDHLLIADGQFRETYRRLYYKDIEAILICPTKGGSVLSALLLLSGSLTMLSLLGGFDFMPLFIFGLVLTLFGFAVLYGKGSVLFGVKTAVQTVVILGVNTRRKATKAEAKLSAEVERVQGELTVDALRSAIYKDADRYGTRVGAWMRDMNEETSSPPPIKTESADSALGV